MKDSRGKLPWTVPAMIVIAVARYFQVGYVDFIVVTALAMVIMRLGPWAAVMMEQRRERAEKARGAGEPGEQESRPARKE